MTNDTLRNRKLRGQRQNGRQHGRWILLPRVNSNDPSICLIWGIWQVRRDGDPSSLWEVRRNGKHEAWASDSVTARRIAVALITLNK